MGFVKGGLFVIVSVLFFISLLVMNSIMVVSFSLDYDNIKQELVPVVKEAMKENINITEAIEEDKYPEIQKYCETLSATDEYTFNVENYSFTVPCSSLSNGTEGVINSAIDGFVYEQYYKEYNCDFWDCFDGNLPLFVVSQHSKDYWQGKFYISLLVSLVLLGLMFLFIEKKTNFPLVAGSLVILSSLLFAKLEVLLKWIINFFLTTPLNINDFFKFLSLVFIQSSKVFTIMLVIGLILLAVGIILKFFAIGFKVNEFFSKFGSKKEKGKIETKEPEKQKQLDKSVKKKK